MSKELTLTAMGQRKLSDLEYRFDSDDLSLQDFVLYGALRQIYSKGSIPEEFMQITDQLRRAGLVTSTDEDAEFQLIDEFESIGRLSG